MNGRVQSPWRGALPEICVAGASVAATAAAGYALAGPGAMALVAVLAAACVLGFLRTLVPPQRPRPGGTDLAGPDPAVPSPAVASYSGYWRRESRVADAQASIGAYEAGLRPQLEHLLASRLAERHGISLYDDPAAARRAFTQGQPGSADLWDWIDPARPAPTVHDQPGIPRRTLTRLIDRLERL